MFTLKPGSRWHHATPFLIFVVITYSWGDVMYGLDTGSFGALQALPAWLRQFGELQPNGNYVLSTERRSIMNSVVWIGKALGCLLFEPIVRRIGYKKLMYIIMGLQIIGVVVELAAKNWIVFSVGRVIAYLAVGLVENACPAYESEITPAPLRGFVTGSLIMLTTLGNLWGALMGRGFQSETRPLGWLIPTAMQLVPAVLLLIGLPFTPESPRWLVLQGKNEEALKALNKIRPKREVDAGMTIREIEAFDQAIEEDKLTPQGGWFDLFRGNYFRRVCIAVGLFLGNQWTGGQFILSYGPTFYIQQGLGNMAFTYNVITQALSLVGCAITIFFLDKVGRRPFLVVGCALQVLFMLLVAGLGGKSNPSTSETNGMVASILLFNLSVKVSLSTNAYLIASEIGGVRMRKKIIGVATFSDVVAAFVVTYSMPYLLGTNGQSGVNLGANVGWIFAGIAFIAFIFVTFFVPELAGRSLEEVDELFAQKLWAWQFKAYKTSGVGARIAQLEGRERAESSIGDEEKGENGEEGRVETEQGVNGDRDGDVKDGQSLETTGEERDAARRV